MINTQLAATQTKVRMPKAKNPYMQVLTDTGVVDSEACHWIEVQAEDFDPFELTVETSGKGMAVHSDAESAFGLVWKYGQPETCIDTMLSPANALGIAIRYETLGYVDSDDVGGGGNRRDISDDFLDLTEELVTDLRLHMGEQQYHKMLVFAGLSAAELADLPSDALIEEHLPDEAA